MTPPTTRPSDQRFIDALLTLTDFATPPDYILYAALRDCHVEGFDIHDIVRIYHLTHREWATLQSARIPESARTAVAKVVCDKYPGLCKHFTGWVPTASK